MSARFVIGRAGTGKTRRCFDEIVRLLTEDPLGAPVYWLLPKQATFTAERLLTCGSGLPAFSRARVLSFQEFGRAILSECGGGAIPEVTAVGRQMILGHLLRLHRDDLKFFKSVAHQAGLAAELDATFAEFERSGKSPDTLADLVRNPDLPENDALAAKLHDLVLLYSAYSKYLGHERLDPHRRLQQVLNCIAQSRSVRGAVVFVDGFYDFTDYERRFLAALAKSAARLEITLTLDPNSPVLVDPLANGDEIGMFHPSERAYRRLHAALVEVTAEVDEALIVRKVERFQSPAIAHLEACLFARHPKTSDAVEGIEFIEAADRRAEVDAAARAIQSLIKGGLRLRDIAVLVRDMDAYHELIDASFREHGLPWFVDRRRSATHHPLIQFTRALPALAIRDFDHEAVMTILKCGLIELKSGDTPSSDLADQLENFVLLHRIHGSAWADPHMWDFSERRLTRADDDDTSSSTVADVSRGMNLLRGQLIEPLLPFVRVMNRSMSSPLPLRQIVTALLRTFDACAVSQTLSQWIATDLQRGRLEFQAEHARVWNELIELLNQMSELLGDEPVTAMDFVEILESALATFDLALTPPTIDQVLVGSVDRTRTPPQLRATIVMGLHEGGFPYSPKENSIFGDAERRELHRRRIEIDPDTHRRLFDERFLGYIAFTRASEHLCLIRPVADEAGRPAAPSSFWRMLRGMFPRIEPTVLPRDLRRDPSCIGTPRQLVTSLLRWARSESSLIPEPHDVWPALYARFAAHDAESHAIDTMRYRAWKALSYDNDARLSPEVTEQLFPNPLRASVSRIESFANCAFKHFAGYGLRLSKREDEDVTRMDLGNVYHGILEQLVREMIQRREDFTNTPREITDAKIKSVAKQIGESLRHEVLLSSARNQYLLRHIERTLDQVVDAQREVAKRGKFRPWKAEVTFGDRDGSPGSLPALKLATPSGGQMILNGKIDRVDLIEDQAAIAVIDYKLGGGSLRLNSVYHGLSLQLLTYLLVLQNSGAALGVTKLTPAAAFYVKLLRRLEPVKHPDESVAPDAPEFHLKEKPRGIFDSRFFPALDAQCVQGKSSVVHATIKKDGGMQKSSDGIEPRAFAAMLNLVEQKLAQLGDQILAGNIEIAPYRIGTTTPCPNCDFRSVCRFDPARQGYRHLPTFSKDQVIANAMNVHPDGGG